MSKDELRLFRRQQVDDYHHSRLSAETWCEENAMKVSTLHYWLRRFKEMDQVYVACFPCDMRKSINGLSARVQLTFDMDPFANHLYVFFNRKGDKAKILRWSNNGWWLYYRKLSRGTFKWVFDNSQTVKGISERQLAWAMERITLLTHKKFGSGSDSVVYPEGCDQLSFFNEPESAADFSVPEPELNDTLVEDLQSRKKKAKGKREKDFSNLVTIVIEHELPESQRNCPNCSHPLHDMKVETTRLLKFIPARFEVEEHRRHIYTCRECAKHDDGTDLKIPFVRALMPNTLIPGSFITPELVAAIINAKYVCAKPLARQLH